MACLRGTSKRKVVFVELLKAAAVRAARNALERVVAELAAAVRSGHDAVFLADHGFLVHLPGKLAVCTLLVDLFTEKQSGHRLS